MTKRNIVYLPELHALHYTEGGYGAIIFTSDISSVETSTDRNETDIHTSSGRIYKSVPMPYLEVASYCVDVSIKDNDAE